MTHKPIKTRRKVNENLFYECVRKLQCSPYQVVTNLLDLNLPILEVKPEITGEYVYKDMYIDNVKFYTYSVTLEHDVGYSIRGFQALDILMYNYLNK